MCPGLGPVVEAEHRDDDAVELRWHAQLAGAVPVLHQPPGRRVGASGAGQGGAEDGGDSGGRSGDLHPARGLVDRVDAQPSIGQHCADHIDVAAVRAVAGATVGVADGVRPLDQIGWHGRPAAQHHRHLDDFPGIHWAVRGRLRDRLASAARNGTRGSGHGTSLARAGGRGQGLQPVRCCRCVPADCNDTGRSRQGGDSDPLPVGFGPRYRLKDLPC